MIGSHNSVSTGNLQAGLDVNINATGAIDTLNVTATTGGVALKNDLSLFVDTISAGTVTSALDVRLEASGSIQTGLLSSGTTVLLTSQHGNIGENSAIAISTPSVRADALEGFVDITSAQAGALDIIGLNTVGDGASYSLRMTNINSVLNVTGVISAPSGTGSEVNLQGRQGINVNGSVGADFVNLYSSTGGTVTIAGAGTVFGSTLIVADSVDLQGAIDAGTGYVSFTPITDNTSIGVAGAAGTLNLSTAELDRITAGLVSFGNRNLAGGILVQNLDTSGANVKDYDLSFYNRGNFGSTGFEINTGTNALTIDVGGNIDVGNLTGGDVSLLAPVGTVTINGVIVANNSLSISVFGDITNAMFGGFLNSPSAVNLASTIGTIGTQLAPLLISTAAISAVAPNGDVYINNLSSAPTVTIGDVTGDTVQIVRTNAGVTGGMLVTGNVGGNDITLRNTAANGGVDLAVGGRIGGIGGGRADSVTLIGKGSGTVTSAVGTVIDTASLTATTDTGVVDIDNTTASSLTAGSTANVRIVSSSASPVTINSANGSNVVIMLTTPGAHLQIANSITGNSSISLWTAINGDIIRTGAGATLNSLNVALTAGGNIGSASAQILTNTSSLIADSFVNGKSIFITETDALSLSTVNGTNVNITAGGNIFKDPFLTINATNLTLTSLQGNIGGPLAQILNTTASNISATAFGNVYLSSNFVGTLKVVSTLRASC